MKRPSCPPASAKSIFFSAMAIADEDQRVQYVQQACEGDEALRNEVDRLLVARESEHSSLFSQAVRQLNPDASPSACLDGVSQLATCDLVDVASHPVIDRYKVLEEIGRGGMGTVYLAQQLEPVKRRVALKVINPGMDSREIIARFEAERQALAMMDHPNIARVFDGGTTAEGRPYFVMELVRGTPITDYCEEHHLDLKTRLKLFLQVCQAVQHAHQKGIIHRDLKPSNVQVTNHDGDPLVKVIDFGIAKALHHDLTDRTLFTHFSELVGTPLYMSPEQADHKGIDIDTRSDVYSLGVLLYELLTGATPFDRETLSKAGVDGAKRMICEVEPPRPSVRVSTLATAADATRKMRSEVDRRKRRSELRGDLDCIVMKALEKRRDSRYESASALARDIQRYLDHEPIDAKPATYRAQVVKWTKRNRQRASLIGALLALVLLAGAAWSGMRIATYRTLTAQVTQDADDATSALAAGELGTAKSVLAGAQKIVKQLEGANHSLPARINQLQAELNRYEEFLGLYERARKNRSYGTGIPEFAYRALALYGLPEDDEWLEQLKRSQVPEEFIAQVAEHVYEMLVLCAHHRLLWMSEADEEEKLVRIADAQRFLQLAKTIREPTKGYYWNLATCSQRLGDLTEGAVRDHHDAEAHRLRALAAQTHPQNAADLFYIYRDRAWGAASPHAREPFRDPLDHEGQLDALQDMVISEPKYFNGNFFLADLLSYVGRHKEALQAWNGCVSIDPSDTAARMNRGTCFIRLGDFKRGFADQQVAIQRLVDRVKSEPQVGYHKFFLADLLVEHSESLDLAGKPAEARVALEEAEQHLLAALRASPEHPRYLSKLGTVRERLSSRAAMEASQRENGGD